jgi:hypothetical protein
MKEILTKLFSDICDTSIGKIFIGNLLNIITISILVVIIYNKFIYVALLLFIVLGIMLTFNLWADTYDKRR